MHTSNPALTDRAFRDAASMGEISQTMTLQGAAFKTAILLAILIVTASFTWSKTLEGGSPGPFLAIGGIGGFILAMITCFKPTASPITAPIYAALEGLFVGGLSALFNLKYPGIVVPAVGLTFATLGAMLLAYGSGIIKATEKFKLGVVAATGGICLMYFVTMILSFFHVNLGFMYGGALGIGISLFVVVIAALNLVLDFDQIDTGVRMGAPKYMEWYGAFGLMVTLVWLYLEILRLLAQLQRRD